MGRANGSISNRAVHVLGRIVRAGPCGKAISDCSAATMVLGSAHETQLCDIARGRIIACWLRGNAVSAWHGHGPTTPSVSVERPGAETLRPQARPVGEATSALGHRSQGADTIATAQWRRTATRRDPALLAAMRPGRNLASLGSPSEQGFWLRTGLVTRVRQGRVELADGSNALRVELRPSGAAPGAGSQLSLATFRALDAPLTQLVRLRVFAE